MSYSLTFDVTIRIVCTHDINIAHSIIIISTNVITIATVVFITPDGRFLRHYY